MKCVSSIHPLLLQDGQPLHEILVKEAEIDWDSQTDAQVGVLISLKQMIIYPPVLALQSLELPFRIYTNVSHYKIEAFILQKQDEEKPSFWKTIGHWSIALKKAERNYYPTERD